MKHFSYRTPEGEVRIKSPLPVRAVESSLALTLITLLFVAWGGYYLLFADPAVFLGKTLSFYHQELRSDCLACHTPFLGVSDESCSAIGCHQEEVADTIHNTLDLKCKDCHREHSGGGFISYGIDEKDCGECHEKLKKDPDSIFYEKSKKPKRITFVSRTIFKHSSHQFPPYYKCWQCHCTGQNTLNTPTRDLFKMESCLICHEEKGCHVCHRYHDKRDPRPVELECIKEEFVGNLVFKTLNCTPFRGLVPGFKELPVCETKESIDEYIERLKREQEAAQSQENVSPAPADNP